MRIPIVLILMIASPICFANSLLSHRGVHQNFDPTGVERDTCTADRIYPLEHEYIENTIASMRAAFDAGADWVEIDVHPTVDGYFVVFHDWTLDCRTNGTGITRNQTLEYLKSIDIGYGYTTDSGESFPLRGKGLGLIPTLSEVLSTFPDKKFLINIKSDQMSEAKAIAKVLAKFPPERRENLMVYGGTESMLDHIASVSDVHTWPSKATIMGCYATFISSKGQDLGACKGRIFGGPLDMAEKIPGWPDRFIALVQSTGGYFYVMGVDSEEDLHRLGGSYTGGIWTDKIEVIGPIVKK